MPSHASSAPSQANGRRAVEAPVRLPAFKARRGAISFRQRLPPSAPPQASQGPRPDQTAPLAVVAARHPDVFSCIAARLDTKSLNALAGVCASTRSAAKGLVDDARRAFGQRRDAQAGAPPSPTAAAAAPDVLTNPSRWPALILPGTRLDLHFTAPQAFLDFCFRSLCDWSPCEGVPRAGTITVDAGKTPLDKRVVAFRNRDPGLEPARVLRVGPSAFAEEAVGRSYQVVLPDAVHVVVPCGANTGPAWSWQDAADEIAVETMASPSKILGELNVGFVSESSSQPSSSSSSSSTRSQSKLPPKILFRFPARVSRFVYNGPPRSLRPADFVDFSQVPGSTGFPLARDELVIRDAVFRSVYDCGGLVINLETERISLVGCSFAAQPLPSDYLILGLALTGVNLDGSARARPLRALDLACRWPWPLAAPAGPRPPALHVPALAGVVAESFATVWPHLHDLRVALPGQDDPFASDVVDAGPWISALADDLGAIYGARALPVAAEPPLDTLTVCGCSERMADREANTIQCALSRFARKVIVTRVDDPADPFYAAKKPAA